MFTTMICYRDTLQALKKLHSDQDISIYIDLFGYHVSKTTGYLIVINIVEADMTSYIVYDTHTYLARYITDFKCDIKLNIYEGQMKIPHHEAYQKIHDSILKSIDEFCQDIPDTLQTCSVYKLPESYYSYSDGSSLIYTDNIDKFYNHFWVLPF